MQKPTVAFLVNGGSASAMGVRARSFAQRLDSDFQIRIAYRSPHKVRAAFQFFGLLLRLRPAVCYVFDFGFSGVLAGGLYRALSGCRLVTDTGDAIYELGKSMGRRNIALLLTKLLEQFAFAASHLVVVRSHPHQKLLASQGVVAEVIPDGVDIRQFRPRIESALRRKYALEGSTVIGVMGSLIWNPRLKMCYGSELIEVLDILRDAPVKGMIIGDGSGIEHLKAMAERRKLSERVVFLGRVPYEDLPPYLNLMDICLSTQTNDVPGQVRTTGKLPLYLACGRFILSSQVGEAARVLPPDMLVEYQGSTDASYPSRLAARIRELLSQPHRLLCSEQCCRIAQANFDYDLLSATVRRAILGAPSPLPGAEQNIHTDQGAALPGFRSLDRVNQDPKPNI